MAIGALPAIRNASESEAIAYQVIGAGPDGQGFVIHNGKTSLAANPVADYLTGTVAIALENENLVTGLDVHVEATGAVTREVYERVEVRNPIVSRRDEPHVRSFGRP